ncbi:MAG: hypothetical protein K1X49_10240 [Saprospiraceae bacterium]|nr:hypothetical protein [Saprospiraceae bacterium]
MAQPIPLPTSHWLHDFPGLKFSAMEFYAEVEATLKAREIPGAKASRINLNQTGIFSAKREYLRVVNGEMTFDICAAPYGTGFFISWWYGERVGTLRTILYRILIKGPFFHKASERKSKYQLNIRPYFMRLLNLASRVATTKLPRIERYKGAVSHFTQAI